MKRITYIALAAVLAGILIIGTTLFFTKGKVSTSFTFNSKTGTHVSTNDERKTYEAGTGIDEIILSETSDAIKVEIGDVKTPTFSYMEGDAAGKLVITEKNGKIILERNYDGNWINIGIVGVDMTDYTTYVTLPKDYEGSLALSSTSGAIKVDGPADLKDLTATSTSGNIHIRNITSQKDILAEATSGAVECTEIKADGNLNAKSNSGNVSIENVEVKENGNFRTTSGSVKLTNTAFGGDITSSSSSGSEKFVNVASGRDFSAGTTSGSINATDTAAGANVNFEASSGAIHFENLASGKAIFIKATSGSVRGTISGKETDYSIISGTTSGSNNLTDSRTGDKELNAKTTSGSIHITFTK